MRKTFFEELTRHMRKNKSIYAITGDLGKGGFDIIAQEFPDRFINGGAAEQACLGMAIGLALEGKIPFFYSITPFLLYRPFELIRNYLVNEQIPVKLIGSGRDDDYKHDGPSHDATDINLLFGGKNKIFNKIKTYFPEDKSEIPDTVKEMIDNNLPSFLSLRR